MNWSTPHAIMIVMKSAAIILSGGQGTRAGGADKGLLPLGDSTRVESVIAALRPQVDELIISCNRNLDRYRAFGHPIVQDTLADFQGPLAGIAAALACCDYDIAVVVPCDCPHPPADLAARLIAALQENEVQLSYAHDGDRSQHLHCALYSECLPSLLEYLATGQRTVRGWHHHLRSIQVDFSDCAGSFTNINTG